MATIPIKPPKVNTNPKNGGFWKQILMIVIGTTISLIFTIIAAQLTERHQRSKDRRLSAMMVMSNIEGFSRNMEEISSYMSANDSIATWLLNKPLEELELMPEEVLSDLLSRATSLLFLTYDKSAESIFSNNIETWKNMGNVKFIDRVGQCFSAMNMAEERWNGWVKDVESTMRNIKDHPDEYEGSSIPMKSLRSEKVRHTLAGIHYWRAWLSYMAATMRYHNLSNMESINISEKELMDYTDARIQGVENTNEAPDFNDYYSAPISPDSITSMREYDAHIEQMKNK
ncbi:MAG: hypothetical protein J6Y98_02245 [Bacteroidales bacterium]|nr:hypothetical protein [Bacteroidales bacterium]